MKITVYKCDECGKVLSDEDKAIPHLSIAIGGPSGIASQGPAGRWGIYPTLPHGIIHFCDPACLATWFVRRLYGEGEITLEIRNISVQGGNR